MENEVVKLFPQTRPDPANPMNSDKLVWGMLENMEYLVRVLNDDQHVVYMSRSMKERFGDLTGKPCYQIFYRREKCDNCISSRSLDSGKPEVKEIQSDEHRYRLMSSPVILESGEKYSVEMFYDITEQKELEIKLNSDLQFARNIQRGMLPVDGVYWDVFRLSALYLPADVLGGDFFDVLRIDEDKSLLYIADVSGHGVHASMLTMFMRGVIQGKLREAARDPMTLLASLMSAFIDLDLNSEIYLSMLLCCYDAPKEELSIINAGHNCYPLIVRDGGRVEEIEAGGLPISKLGRRMGHSEVKTPLRPGERLVLYTDGILEEFGDESDGKSQKSFGVEDLKALLCRGADKSGKALAAEIAGAAAKFSGANPKDDRAVLIADII